MNPLNSFVCALPNRHLGRISVVILANVVASPLRGQLSFLVVNARAGSWFRRLVHRVGILADVFRREKRINIYSDINLTAVKAIRLKGSAF